MLRYAVTMAGVMFIAAQTGLAAVVFSDSFEGVPGDPGPDLASSTGDYDPAWQFVTEGLTPDRRSSTATRSIRRRVRLRH